MVVDCTFRNNFSGRNGGAITQSSGNGPTASSVSGSHFVDNSAHRGGAIFINGNASDQGNLTVADSTFSANTANVSGGAITNQGTLRVSNTTIHGNSVAGTGGGIHNQFFSPNTDSGQLSVVHSTIASNASGNDGSGAGGGIHNIGTMTLENSILAGNHNDPEGANTPQELTGGSGTHNIEGKCIIQAATGLGLAGSGTVDNVDPLLTALGDFGGSTQVRMLQADSPAINAAVVGANSPARDQRGIVRPFGGAPDIGAVEFVDIVTPGDHAADPSLTNANWNAAAIGSYAGLMKDNSGNLLGSISLLRIRTDRATGNGAFSARLIFQGSSYSVRGVLGADGSLNVALPQRDGTTLTLALQLSTTGSGAFKIGGTIDRDGTTANLDLQRASYDRRINPSARAGSYTLLLPSDATWPAGSPGGHGYALMTMRTDGKATLRGVLGDGSRFSVRAVLSNDEELPLFQQLYRTKPKGFIGGKMSFREVANVSDLDGWLHWKKSADVRERQYAAGFDLMVAAIGSSYAAPFRGELVLSQLARTANNCTWELGGGNLGGFAPGLKTVSWAEKKITYMPTGQEKLSVRATSRTGWVSGNYSDRATGARLKFGGVAFQKQGLVGGAFGGVGETGSLLMLPVNEPRLQVRSFVGNATIANGDLPPTGPAGTDFGAVGVDGGYAERSFRLRNTGIGTLFLLGAPTVSGGGFALVDCRMGPLAPGEETVMTIRFDPTETGPASGRVSIASNSVISNPFSFAIGATGIAGSVISDSSADGNWQGVAAPTPQAAPLSNPTGIGVAPFGNYSGLLQKQSPGAEIPGQMSVRLSTNGAFSGRVELDGVKTTVRGTFLANGSAALLVTPRGGGNPLMLALQMEQSVNALAYRIRGTITRGNDVYIVDLTRNDSSRSNPSGNLGAYTMLTIANDDLGAGYPGGEGAITVLVGADGRVRAKGVLGDGERFSTSGYVSAEHEWQIYRTLYRTRPKGHLAGTLTFRDEAGVSDFDGVLQWVRRPNPKGRIFPFGFKQRIAALGARYTAPARGVRVQAWWQIRR